MYSAFSEAIRLFLFFVSRITLALAMNGFKYQGVFPDKRLNCFIVKYTFNRQDYSEQCDEFINSPYIKALSSKQLHEIIEKISENKTKHKIYTLSLLDASPDIFTVKNNKTNFTTEKLLSDIVSDSALLENLDATSIKLLINSAIQLTNAGFSISSSNVNDAIGETPALRVVK